MLVTLVFVSAEARRAPKTTAASRAQKLREDSLDFHSTKKPTSRRQWADASFFCSTVPLAKSQLKQTRCR